MRRRREPKIIIAWPHSEDNEEFAKALKKLKIIEGYTVTENELEIYMVSYRDEVVITKRDVENMFDIAKGFIPTDFINEAWLDLFKDVRRGKIASYTDDQVVIVAT